MAEYRVTGVTQGVTSGDDILIEGDGLGALMHYAHGAGGQTSILQGSVDNGANWVDVSTLALTDTTPKVETFYAAWPRYRFAGTATKQVLTRATGG